jgi:hypothetical protein
MEPLSIEQVLAAEADEISGGTAGLSASLEASDYTGQEQHKKRARLNADERDRHEADKDEVKSRKAFYRSLNKLNRGAICCSGGGIRSATFCLGVVQGVAGYDVESGKRDPRTVTAENSLLGRLQYISTVSGGGYFGSWLSAWRAREKFPAMLANLVGRPLGPDVEPPEISWLRAYSNYLTPQLGITSADSWAAVAILLRNLLLNWLVIVPVLCLVVLGLKIVAALSTWVAHGTTPTKGQIVVWILLIGIGCLVDALAFASRHRPPRRPPLRPHGHEAAASKAPQPGNVTEKHFLFGGLIWAILSAIAVTVFFVSVYFWSNHGADGLAHIVLKTAAAGLVIYAVGWFFGLRFGRGWLADFVAWSLSGLVYGGLVGLGAGLFALLQPYGAAPNYTPSGHLLVAAILGVPWVLLAQLTADNIFGGLVSYEALSDSDREWLGRAAGWLMAAALAWLIIALLVFGGEVLVHTLLKLGHWAVVTAGGIGALASGVFTALVGKSAATPATSAGAQDTWGSLARKVAMAVAGPIFFAGLVVALSFGLDKALLGGSLVEKLQVFTDPQSMRPIIMPLLKGFAITLIVGLGASYFVNINRFSLHALYRNRLTRAYLGASQKQRQPDLFTGFDAQDNIRFHKLWSKTPAENVHRLFHVVNIALNIVSTKRLAWQERKAESFTVSPLHCGSANLGYRPSDEYGDGPKTAKARQEAHAGKRDFGIALGTAMAISGAAVSPNMGYNSSPSVALLLTLFNTRLGWWLGNPGEAGNDSYNREGPMFAAKPLFAEAFGMTTDARRYVYLSDGGHFENLALYEMVRRRCRFIVLIDSGQDGKFAFEDLGNAVRKIYIDLGIRIRFNDAQANLPALRTRPTALDGPPDQIPYYAVGTIEYEDADGHEDGCADGCIVYIKPAVHGTEGAGIRSYATAHEDFPHETTVDQWFTESQFESYRSLGLDIADRVLSDGKVKALIAKFIAGAGAAPPPAAAAPSVTSAP